MNSSARLWCRALLLVGGVMVTLAGSVGPGRAQVPAPAPGANICVTEVGWCHLPSLTAPHGVECVCLTAQNAQVRGFTRFFPNSAPPSPYLRPHTGAPTTGR